MIKLDAAVIAREVNAGKLDPVEVTDAFLARIDERNGALNAIVRHDPGSARREAAAVAARIGRGEKLALAGVPIVVKDNIWVADRKISQGSRLFADFVPPLDAIAVERAKAAGAVLIGIGNAPEFACKGQTNSPLHGIARHPMDLSLTPGGSSGGNAAALAAGFAPIALGTDGGGSGRRPPAHTGTVGFKPSFGAIPYGLGFPEPFWGIAVIAPMGRTLADVALLFGVVAGVDARDPETAAIAAPAPIDIRKLRIAYAPKLGLDVPVDADCEAAIASGVRCLGKAGWNITHADPKWPPGITEASFMAMQAGGLAALHGEAFKQNRAKFDPDIAAQIERGLTLTGAEVAAALEASQRVKRSLAAFFADFDLLLCPTAPCVAWDNTRLGPSHIGGVEVLPRGHAVFTPFFNHALTPALSLPCGQGRDGLPIGMQMIAPRGADHTILAAAAHAEMALAELNDYSRCKV
jgi:aspartyl-tRNA(Asn)/glutamyl-tRNA(Gln) amidotransferase subunit A